MRIIAPLFLSVDDRVRGNRTRAVSPGRTPLGYPLRGFPKHHCLISGMPCGAASSTSGYASVA